MRREPAVGCSWSQDPYVVRNDWQSRGLAMAAALTRYKKLAKLAT
ncbi:hypothetical protein B7755_052215 [Streptomyces sp. NBS 14/10]|nr:hypothetical protein [Streptomyces sp. NBS 14/10]KAK1176672.1 hypothetical protein B7755_052215 [Streptomyces sp. NBS 14/10]